MDVEQRESSLSQALVKSDDSGLTTASHPKLDDFFSWWAKPKNSGAQSICQSSRHLRQIFKNLTSIISALFREAYTYSIPRFTFNGTMLHLELHHLIAKLCRFVAYSTLPSTINLF